MIDVLDGTLLINSNEDITTFKVIFNQLIDNDNAITKLDNISKNLSNKKKVLLVDDDYVELTRLSNELKRNNFDVISVMYGDDSIERLSRGETFDYLFIDDEMMGGNAVNIIKKIDELKLNNLIKIVMLDRSKESIKNHYVNDYSFVDYIFKDDIKNEITRIKEKY